MFTIEINGLDKLNGAINKTPASVRRELAQAIKTSVNIIRPIMVSESPHRSGKLREHIYAKANGLQGEVGPNLDITPYAVYVHNGTTNSAPYIIRPTNKKALWWPGALHPVRKVVHPGIKANPFVERTYHQIKEPVQRIFAFAIDKIVKNFHNA